MENRIGCAPPGRATTTQVGEDLRRISVVPTRPAEADRLLAETTSRRFLAALEQLAASLPHPGPTIRITATVGRTIGHADIDPANLGDLAVVTRRRATTLPALLPPSTTRPALHVVGGAR